MAVDQVAQSRATVSCATIRFATGYILTINTAASGGDLKLLSLNDDPNKEVVP